MVKLTGHIANDMQDYPKENITGVILAGGRARRMGGEDKGLINLHGRAMIKYAVDGLAPQVSSLIINANRNIKIYQKISGHKVIRDIIDDFAGPLAGMLSAMQYVKTPYILTIPCDCPFVSPQLAFRLHNVLKQQNAQLSTVFDGRRIQPVFALLPCALGDELLIYLNGGERKVERWYKAYKTALADFSDDVNSFLNINNPDDQLRVEKLLQSSCKGNQR